MKKRGGNNIPVAYLDRFNADTDSWLKRIGARHADDEGESLPHQMGNFVKNL